MQKLSAYLWPRDATSRRHRSRCFFTVGGHSCSFFLWGLSRSVHEHLTLPQDLCARISVLSTDA
uniref:Uncharacterized protein n=1 Tax=Arundo donax TaxID=35708 RepID=A0A0A9CAK8_ARUDO